MWRLHDARARFPPVSPAPRYRAAPVLRQESVEHVDHVALWRAPDGDGGPDLPPADQPAAHGTRARCRAAGATIASRYREREGYRAARVGNPPDSAVCPRRYRRRAERWATGVTTGAASEPSVAAGDYGGAGADAAMDASRTARVAGV